MKRLIIILATILPLSVYSQRMFSDGQWMEDLDYMVNRIDSVHPGLCSCEKRTQMHKMALELKENIPVLSDNEILVELMKIVTYVQDGHTRLHGKNLTQSWYPVRLEKFSDGYYITAASKGLSGYIGNRVLRINGLAVETVFDKLMAVSSGDNMYGREYFAPIYLTMTSIVSGLHITEKAGDPLHISTETNGQTVEMLVSPVPYNSGEDLGWYWKEYAVPATGYSNIMNNGAPLPLYLQNYNKPYWYIPVSKNSVYFAFNSCENDDKESFRQFNSRLWKAIDSLNATYLIIDLRNNFGGSNSILEPLLHEIIKHDRINREGHLYILTGKKTFSAALHCATWIEFHCNPVFAGEPTAAGPNNFADPDFSFLPNSKILLMISKYYWQNSWPWDIREYIEPAIKMSLSAKDYFSFKDPLLEEVMKLIKVEE